MASPDLGATTMDRTGIDETLADNGFGVLALAAAGRAYPLPMSFGYDGERCYFAFLRTGEQSRKREHAGDTDRGALLVTDIESAHEWRSAVVAGGIEPLPESEWDDAVAALEDNGWHPNLFSAAAPTQGIEWWALDVAEATGRRAALPERRAED